MLMFYQSASKNKQTFGKRYIFYTCHHSFIILYVYFLNILFGFARIFVTYTYSLSMHDKIL